MPDLFIPIKTGFEDPIEMLITCHDRVRHFTGVLERLPGHIAQHGVDVDAQSAIRAIIRYFDVAAPLHHADEDEDLFPALQGILNDEALDRVMAELTAEHETIHVEWLAMKQVLQALAEGKETRLDPKLLLAFARQYQHHARREEEEVYPFAARLPAQLITALGERMQARRRADI